MKIIINGAGFVNKGAEAMALTVQTELTKRIPNCEFFLWRPPPGDCRPALSSGFIPFQFPFDKKYSFWHWPKGKRIALRLWSLLELCRSRDPKDICAAFANRKSYMVNACSHYLNRSKVAFDAFVDISGFTYGDSWGISGFQRIEPLMSYFQKNGKPAVFLPQAWGSFNKPQIRQALLQILGHKNTFFFSRDESSCRNLEQALEKPQGSVSVTPDIVFGFHGGTPGQGENVLRKMGCTRNRPIIGLAPNMRVYERVEGKGMGNGYLQALVKLIEHCHKHHDVDIVLQANEIDASDNRVDDRYLCSIIANSVSNPDRCFMTRAPLTAEATKALIGQFDYIIGSRFHSLVFGLSQGVPGLAISWSHKYRELFSLFGLGDSVHECQNINVDAIIETFVKGWTERKRQRELILTKAKQLQEEVNILFDVVAEIIQGVSPRNK